MFSALSIYYALAEALFLQVWCGKTRYTTPLPAHEHLIFFHCFSSALPGSMMHGLLGISCGNPHRPLLLATP